MVTRETSIAEGLAALQIAAPDGAVGRLAAYAEMLADEAVRLGFLGPKEVGRVVPRHVLESCALVPLLPREGWVIDVGAGAGLPGLPIACLRTEPVILLESNLRRAEFLRRATEALDVRVEVRAGRAEDAARSELRDSCSAAVARALAAPAVALELCLPFVTVDGVFVSLVTPAEGTDGHDTDTDSTDADAPNGAPRAVAHERIGVAGRRIGVAGRRIGVAADVSGLEPASRLLGGGPPQLRPLEVPGADAPRWAMIVTKLEPTPDRFPRRTGVPARKPLG